MDKSRMLKLSDLQVELSVSRWTLYEWLKEGKLQGIVKLSDIFNTVAALLFDEQDPEERHRLLRDYRLFHS